MDGLLRYAIRDSLIERNIQLDLQILQAAKQSGEPFVLAEIVEAAQTFVGFSCATVAMRKLVGGESLFITGCAGKRRRFREELRGMFVVDVFVAIEACERFVELRALGVVLDSALEKIFSELKIFALGLDPQSESRLRRIIQRGDARVPGHVPRGHVPEKNRARLQRRDLPEKKKDAA